MGLGGFKKYTQNLKNINFCKSINTYQPDEIIYIDYPGFNMVIAKWAKKWLSKSLLY